MRGSAYHLPNVVCVFIGGLLGDRIGSRRAAVLFSVLVFTGVVTVAMAPTIPFMLMGRYVRLFTGPLVSSALYSANTEHEPKSLCSAGSRVDEFEAPPVKPL
mgnify:CR=1 FL=1